MFEKLSHHKFSSPAVPISRTIGPFNVSFCPTAFFVLVFGRASYWSAAFAIVKSVLTPKWFKVSKYFSHHTIEGCFWFFEANYCNRDFSRSPRAIALKRGTPCRQRKLDQHSVISRKRCKIWGRPKLVLFNVHTQEAAYVLSIGTEIGNLEWPWTA